MHRWVEVWPWGATDAGRFLPHTRTDPDGATALLVCPLRGGPPQSVTPPGAALETLERLLQVAHQIVSVLDADGQPHQAFGDAQ